MIYKRYLLYNIGNSDFNEYEIIKNIESFCLDNNCVLISTYTVSINHGFSKIYGVFGGFTK